MNSTTEKYCSIALIWIVTTFAFHPQTQKLGWQPCTAAFKIMKTICHSQLTYIRTCYRFFFFFFTSFDNWTRPILKFQSWKSRNGWVVTVIFFLIIVFFKIIILIYQPFSSWKVRKSLCRVKTSSLTFGAKCFHFVSGPIRSARLVEAASYSAAFL